MRRRRVSQDQHSGPWELSTMQDEAEIQARWVEGHEAREQIIELRRRVFTGEQGFGEDMVHHERDADALHLCAMSGETMVGAIAAYLYEPGAPELADLRLPKVDGLSVQIGKRVELAEYRGRLVTEQLGTAMMRQICESLRPARFFLIIRGSHRRLADRYVRRGFVRHADIGSGDDAMTVMVVEGREAMEEFYAEHRALSKRAASDGRRLTVPSLVRFLADSGRDDLLAWNTLMTENNYLEPLSLTDELPRLAAQGQMMIAEQRPRLAATPFPPAPASLLDIGTGPGDYLAAVAKEKVLSGYRVQGVEPSSQLLARARSAFPELTFRRGSAYATGEPDSSHDVITANFLFVHLSSPDLALMEMARVLRPGGLLYVVDVNDDSFRGPDEIRSLVEAHDRHYTGDRTVLTDLPRRAGEFGLVLERRFATTLRNTGGPEPVLGQDEILLGRREGWSLLSFVRSQKVAEDMFQEAEEYYFRTGCEISLDIETQVYRKQAAGEE
ncbi:SAM-dependent methyltransferase [Streptosporangium becharense]|uniref:SAM-dependent methyltransferase n=1 Tax=Streptosporangium becharense TaxID=1816182 RepID=A0A7W9IM24_9ACTN|nr:methyltransferase domain-containing protein [Streptosporangium becharense]MBB2915083.1 SAM-dependent methyltransferase [Streptosporangium becharense]MBB5822845.1 SAM-dependent methyltransferase [Streptosporangium becharense]